MIGYAYLDFDNQLVIKDKNYIEVDNPFFWDQNRNLIVKKWKFDTNDFQSMLFMFRQIRDLQVNRRTVIDFANSLNFDLERLGNANKV